VYHGAWRLFDRAVVHRLACTFGVKEEVFSLRWNGYDGFGRSD
jgi:hypothetical protein